MGENKKKRTSGTSPKKKIRAVFFDAGGTLLKPYPSVGHVYSRVARRYGVQVSPADINRTFIRVWKLFQKKAPLGKQTAKRERNWWRGIVTRVMGPHMTKKVFEPYFREVYELFARPACWRLFPDAFPTLKALEKKGYILGIISNWDSRLHRICIGLGLTRYVDFVLASAVEGVGKPQRAIFKRALTLAGVSAGEALHVGDSQKDDLRGARGAGLHALLLDRSQRGRIRGARVKGLRDVVRWVQQQPPRRLN